MLRMDAMNLKMLYSGLIIFLHLLAAESTFYLADTYLNKMVEMKANNQPCRVHHDRRFIQNVLDRMDPKYIQRVTPQALNEVSSSCMDVDQVNKTGGFIFPGTKWCGPGSIAKGYNDLGVHSNEDRCCRDHDHCPNQLERGQCRHGICNMSPFTRSHCDCDEAFSRCLHNVNSDVANLIGSIYFNVAQVTCFKERRSCPQSMSDCGVEYQQIEPYLTVPNGFFRQKQNYLSALFSGLLRKFHKFGYKRK